VLLAVAALLWVLSVVVTVRRRRRQLGAGD
jgi:hypothetical protein